MWPLYWSACVQVPFSRKSAPFQKYFTMPFLTPVVNARYLVSLTCAKFYRSAHFFVNFSIEMIGH